MSETRSDPQENKDFDMKSIQILADAITKAIGDNANDKRFVDITRIPLICVAISGIHESLKDLKEMVKEISSSYVTHDQFKPYRTALNIIASALILSFIGGLTALLIRSS